MRSLSGLRAAYKKEKDPTLKRRMLGILHVQAKGRSALETASMLGCSDNTIRNWTKKFAKGGIAGLHDGHSTGKPRLVPRDKIEPFMRREAGKTRVRITSTEMRRRVHKRFKVKYSVSHIRKMMYQMGLYSKRGAAGRRRISRATRL